MTPPATLHLHRAERTDLLAEALAGLLDEPLSDPFAQELVVVPARGVERWLTQRLSHRLGTDRGDGVCAGVRFISPWSLTSLLLDRDEVDPWEADRLTWPLLAAVDEVMDEPWAGTLARHLGQGPDSAREDLQRQDRRWAVARRLAGLFASYGVQRPDLLADWTAGGHGDGLGGRLAGDLLWQPELWRRLLAKVDAPDPAARLVAARERLLSGAGGLDLPPRISLFGHTRIASSEFGLLQALATRVEVHLWLPQPSEALWQALESARSDGEPSGPVPRARDRSVRAVGHPLLASLGRDTRELHRTLTSAPGLRSEWVGGATATPETLLGWLQHDLRSNQSPAPGVRAARVVAPDDRSVQVHACHGAARQVDVLREVLVGLLADDPTLEPRDIAVMCPDVEAFAPLVAAGFDLAEVAEATPGAQGHPAHGLRVRMADRSLVSTNPVLALASTLVDLVGGRMTATDLLDLAATAPVRNRFGFDDDALDRIATWITEAGVRWGLDGSQRARYGLDLTDNTWRTGLDRILLGAAMSEQHRRVVGRSLPLDDVSSGDLSVVGRLAEFLDRLTTFLHACESAQSVEEWLSALETVVLSVAAPPRDEVWQEAQFLREVEAVRTAAGPDTRLRLADLRALLSHRLGGRPSRSNFRTGMVTVSTLVPMRSVPHRVVCLVGLDDGAFPRSGTVDGDDALARNPVTGEKDPRAEDRQLFLDAVLAATDTLVVTYSGASEQTGLAKPPAVPLGELLDALDTTATGSPRPDGTANASVTDQVRVVHPLQPYDPRNLVDGALVPGVFSFDPAALAGAVAARSGREPVQVLVPTPLSAEPPEDISLADLRDFFAHPVKFFLRQRLGLAGVQQAPDTPTAIPIDLDGLEKWAVGDRILSDVLAGWDPQASMVAEQFRGHLPPAELGTRTLKDVVAGVRPLFEVASAFRTGAPRTLDVDVPLPDGRRLVGTVTDVHGNNLVRVTYSSLAAKHRLAAWVDLLALRLGHEDESWVSHAIGRYGKNARHAQIGPLDERAEAWLLQLVDLYDRGRREPLPMPLKTSLAWAEEDRRRSRFPDVEPDVRAAKEWVTDRFADNPFPREHDDVWHARAFGPAQPLSVLTGPARADEQFSDAEHRLGQYARRLWTPLLDNERVGGA